jgi:hypothetical protein
LPVLGDLRPIGLQLLNQPQREVDGAVFDVVS